MSNAEQTSSVLKTTITSGEEIKKGQIVTIDENGQGRYALAPDHPEAKFHPIFQKESVKVSNEEIGKYVLDVAAADGSKNTAIASLITGNGNILTVFNAQNNIVLTAHTQTGTLINKEILAGSDNLHIDVALTNLPNGNVAVAFNAGTPVALATVIVSEEGEMITSINRLDNVTDAVSLSVSSVSGGGFVIGYAAGPFRSPAFVVFDQQAQVQVSPVVVEQLDETSKVTHNQSVSVIGLGNSSLAIAYSRVFENKGIVKVATFSTNGHPLGTTVQVGQETVTNNSAPFVKTAKLKNNSFAVGSYGAVEPGFQVQLFDVGANPVGVCQVLDKHDNSDSANRLDMVGLDDGNLGVVWSQSQLAASCVITPNGAFLFRRANLGACDGSVAIAAVPGEGAVVVAQHEGTLRVGRLNKNLYGDLTATRINAGEKYSALIAHALKDKHEGKTTVLLAGAAGVTVEFGIFSSYELKMRRPIGVSLNATTKGQPISVQLEGVVELAEPFKFPYVLNARDNAIPGQKLAVVGNTAILHGIE